MGDQWAARQMQMSVLHKMDLELDIERDLRRLYIPDNYKSKHYKLALLNPVFQILIPNCNYKSVDDNSC